MALDIRQLKGAELAKAIPRIAELRIAVFREWPYLYDGDSAYEARYLAPYKDNPAAVVAGAFDKGSLVGAATAMPLISHADDFAEAFSDSELDAENLFYCAESVLLPEYRGQGAGHAFFDIRERAARDQGFEYVTFCAVSRPKDHPARPRNYRPLDRFWRARGYLPLEGISARFKWKDIGDTRETEKRLQFWGRRL